MDKERLNVNFRIDSSEKGIHSDKEVNVEVRGSETPKEATDPMTGIRRSTRLLNKRKERSSAAAAVETDDVGGKTATESPKHTAENDPIDGVSTEIPSVSSPEKVLLYECRVHSKDRINLVVDLKSDPSVRVKSLRDLVCSCPKHVPMFGSFRKHIEFIAKRDGIRLFPSSGGNEAAAGEGGQTETLTSVVPGQSSFVLTGSGKFQNDPGSGRFDLGSQQKDSSCSQTEGEENVLTSTTTEVNQETPGYGGRSAVGDGERIESAEGMEVSGEEGNGLVISATDNGRMRKKRTRESLSQSQSEGRLLRSTKVYGAQIVRRGGKVVRRSSRFVSKHGVSKLQDYN